MKMMRLLPILLLISSDMKAMEPVDRDGKKILHEKTQEAYDIDWLYKENEVHKQQETDQLPSDDRPIDLTATIYLIEKNKQNQEKLAQLKEEKKKKEEETLFTTEELRHRLIANQAAARGAELAVISLENEIIARQKELLELRAEHENLKKGITNIEAAIAYNLEEAKKQLALERAKKLLEEKSKEKKSRWGWW